MATLIFFGVDSQTQSSSTRQLIFPIDYLVSYLSHVCTLLPGDLIYTGTPSGVGVARTPPVFMKPGDVAEVTVEGLVVAGAFWASSRGRRSADHRDPA